MNPNPNFTETAGEENTGLVEVFNLATLESKFYTCSPRAAVIAAYAQDRKDFNTWDYENRYGKLVETGRLTLLIGDWSVFIDGRRVTK